MHARHDAVRRLVYASEVAGRDARGDLRDILARSRANNGIDGISGVLWTDGRSFLQVLEGPPESVSRTYRIIENDPRHRALRIVSDERGVERAFGDWAMASYEDDDADTVRRRLGSILRASPDALAATLRGALGLAA